MRSNQRRRRGGAALELLVCLPVLAVLVLGTLESTTMIFVQQSLTIVAYESMRTAIRGNSTDAEVVDRVNHMIAERGLVNATAEFTPASIEGLAAGTPITVRVTAPSSDNAILPLRFFTRDLEAVTTMNKE